MFRRTARARNIVPDVVRMQVAHVLVFCSTTVSSLATSVSWMHWFTKYIAVPD